MKIIISLQVKLTKGEFARYFSEGTTNIEAYLKLMRAHFHLVRNVKEDIFLAQQMLREVIAIDPKYLVLILGFQMLIAFQNYDMQSQPRAPLHPQLGDTRARRVSRRRAPSSSADPGESRDSLGRS